MATDSVSVTPTPIGLTERALGPDLARGMMLLFIALASSHYTGAATRAGGAR
ncbi:hypothetical protein ACFT2C_24845 [Promicromonospora sp. NPDC057138]|uniref:hypothetical protein n=1 Tax=Promicromonospora sp. NPDC057138 TaxID=3346031 RepID=UPI003643E41A